jgi:hypothetical protein
MGSPPEQQDEGLLPQQALPAPETTRNAAWPYFSFTTSLTFIGMIPFYLERHKYWPIRSLTVAAR